MDIQPGWYKQGGDIEAYWNGSQWTGQTRSAKISDEPLPTGNVRKNREKAQHSISKKKLTTMLSFVVAIGVGLYFINQVLAGQYPVSTSDFSGKLASTLETEFGNVSDISCNDGDLLPWSTSIDKNKTYDCTFVSAGDTYELDVFVDTLRTKDGRVRTNRGGDSDRQVLDYYMLDYKVKN